MRRKHRRGGELDEKQRHRVFVLCVAFLCSCALLFRVRQRQGRNITRELFPEDFSSLSELPDRLSDDVEIANAEERVFSKEIEEESVALPSVKIVTGNFAYQVEHPEQSSKCLAVQRSLHLLWAAWSTKAYVSQKQKLHASLKALDSSEHCVLFGHGPIQWSFPLSYRKKCDSKTSRTLKSRSYLKDKTKVIVNWLLLRPDLITLQNVLLSEKVRPHFEVHVTDHLSDTAFMNEGCPRFATILNKREVYQQRLLLVTLADLEFQISKLRSDSYSVIRHDVDSPKTGGHSLSASAMSRRPKIISKTPSQKTKLVFVAGLEGVGHHLFSILGKKRTTRPLYEALTKHLADSAWRDDSLKAYDYAFEELSREMKNAVQAFSNNPDRVVFLNTVWSKRDVNMYSIPWGGPRCKLKRYARVLCTIDVLEIVRAARAAEVDLKMVVVSRALGAATVSASLHRPFGTVVSETKMLSLSRSLLDQQVARVPSSMVHEMSYENVLNDPDNTAAELANFLELSKESKLREHFVETMRDSSKSHSSVADAWREEVDSTQLVFMSDLLNL